MDATPTLLLTSFGPFPGVADNPTGRVASRVAARLRAPTLAVEHLELPTHFDVAAEALVTCAERLRREGTLCGIVSLGVASSRTRPEIEMVAHNRRATGRPDAAGRALEAAEATVAAGGAATLATSLPAAAILAACAARELEVGTSQDAGRYICNEVFYAAAAWRERVGFEGPVGFVHIPDPRGEAAWEAVVGVVECVGREAAR